MHLCIDYWRRVYVGNKISAQTRAKFGQSKKANAGKHVHCAEESHLEQGLRLADGGLLDVRWHIHWFWVYLEFDF